MENVNSNPEKWNELVNQVAQCKRYYISYNEYGVHRNSQIILPKSSLINLGNLIEDNLNYLNGWVGDHVDSSVLCRSNYTYFVVADTKYYNQGVYIDTTRRGGLLLDSANKLDNCVEHIISNIGNFGLRSRNIYFLIKDDKTYNFLSFNEDRGVETEYFTNKSNEMSKFIFDNIK